MPKLVRRPPKLCFHKGTGQACVHVEGRRENLGNWPGGPKSTPPQAVIDKYNAILASIVLAEPKRKTGFDKLTIAEVASKYIVHANEYYKTSNEAQGIRSALRELVIVHGREPIADFGPRKLEALITTMAKTERSRQGINKILNRIKRFFRWAVRMEYVLSSVREAVVSVPAISRGRTPAREHVTRQLVSRETIDATMPHLPIPVAAMVRVQLLSGARPGEILALTMGQLDRSDPTAWLYRPHAHKTQWRGRTRTIAFGPLAIAVLEKFIREDELPLFSPELWMVQRKEIRRAKRKSPVQPSQLDRTVPSPARPAGNRYSASSYLRAIKRACRLAQVQAWSPNQLRKTAATTIRSKFDLPHAQAVLGHSDPATTAAFYAMLDEEKAKRVAREIG